MTRIICASNVNHAFMDGFHWLKVAGIEEQTRNGPCLVAPGPVITEYRYPCERVLFNPVRDCNHVFHLMESIWMMAGENRVAWLLQFNSKFSDFAEPDGRQHGAYGHRWRRHFGYDQIKGVAEALKKNPNDRRVVMTMWSPVSDFGMSYQDLPCNTQIYFDGRGGKLNMTVCCRSNDILWGAYGANAVHMSILQEVVAHGAGLEVGVYRQFSNNFHAYMENAQVKHFIENPPMHTYDFYGDGQCARVRIFEPDDTIDQFLHDCERFVKEPNNVPVNRWLRMVAAPLRDAYLDRKAGKEDWARQLTGMPECDWKLGFTEWVKRRDTK